MAPSAPILAAVGLGSNVGDRHAHLTAAVAALASLPRTRFEARSRLFETEPVTLPGSGSGAGGPYLNAAATLTTHLTARELLDCLLEIERTRGRDRARESRWGPRTLDLDLLLYGDQVIDEPGLTVPHPRLHERLFVLAPLVEIAGQMCVPTLGQTITDLHAALTA